ncbi:aminoglycoside phosphotransferase family protein [Nocardiopsis sp. L17-MgMaSL7]|uniref:phosphotransferase n=1 Tax=Nocardiopsis sp. L17-MgMaSL7 TaxID=1938893 RepID=UPI000D70BCC6|nr:aminoglycoside phosphotransferase family protein [Nocardiopsis sp. L17-MgMaSL7]PWV46742.1 phosphotransferase family enzyme [Nocardiopsis sp. L17-MgMaSL7]
MREPQFGRAVAAATSVATSLGLDADEAVVLHDSNRLTLRLLPCDVLARVAPAEHGVARYEVELALRLAATGSPVAALDPRVTPGVHERDGFEVTLWTHHAPVPATKVPPPDYADALARLHHGMRAVDHPSPRFTDRVARARGLVADRDRTPELTAPDRELLARALDDLEREVTGHGAPEQLLHGEPHPGNLLATAEGPLFVDLETCCRGPVEFDLAHAPDEVAAHYPGTDPELLRACRLLVLAMITAWRWDRDDQFPDGRRCGAQWLALLREQVSAPG